MNSSFNYLIVFAIVAVVVVGAKSQGSCACDLMKCLKVEKCDEGEKKVPYGPCNCCHMCVPEYTDDVDPLNGCTQEVCEKVKCLKNSNCAKDEVRSVYGPCKCCAICIPASLVPLPSELTMEGIDIEVN